MYVELNAYLFDCCSVELNRRIFVSTFELFLIEFKEIFRFFFNRLFRYRFPIEIIEYERVQRGFRFNSSENDCW